MGQISMETTLLPGSVLDGNQQIEAQSSTAEFFNSIDPKEPSTHDSVLQTPTFASSVLDAANVLVVRV